MRELPLTQGYVALVDDDDFEAASPFNWHARVVRRKKGGVLNVYANRSIPKEGGGQLRQSLHCFIVKPTNGLLVDHIDHNGLNCQKSNLRLVNGTQNQGNRRKRHDSIGEFKGVYWDKYHNKWRSDIQAGPLRRCLGYFTEQIEAAKAYDAAAVSYFG